MALKRKIESETVKKCSKVEGSKVKKKPLTKAELMAKLKVLEDRSKTLSKENVKHLETNEKLSKENAKHLDTITKLESYIKSLQRNETSSIVEHAKKAQFSAQTEIDEFCHTLDARFVSNFSGNKYS